MKVILTPQRLDIDAEYHADGDVLTVTIGEESDTFDFSAMPDGVAEAWDFETTLPRNPLVRAERVNGELTVTLRHWYGADASDEEKLVREVTL